MGAVAGLEPIACLGHLNQGWCGRLAQRSVAGAGLMGLRAAWVNHHRLGREGPILDHEPGTDRVRQPRRKHGRGIDRGHGRRRC